jgi:hypothetical protein
VKIFILRYIYTINKRKIQVFIRKLAVRFYIGLNRVTTIASAGEGFFFAVRKAKATGKVNPRREISPVEP